MKISIADKDSDRTALAKLFSSNLTPEYISHSELQGYRAVKPGEWAKNIDTVVHDEIVARLAVPLREFPADRSWRGVVEAHDDNTLVGVALVTTCYEAATPYGIIEDIVVDRTLRGGGRGEKIMRWILDHFRQAGIKRAFLESGGGNERAHHLFERIGFKTLSVVMMKDL
jgi:N-acetylglutamate synthase-like GNAT family acetyltransferase